MSDEKPVTPESQELDEQQLESVAGGITTGGCVVLPPIFKLPIERIPLPVTPVEPILDEI
jgi:hypothetical protein